MLRLVVTVQAAFGFWSNKVRNRVANGEAGFTTAELLANAALGVAALVGIWALFSGVGEEVVTYIKEQIGIGK